MKFNELNIIKPILSALEEQGYEQPTPIQEQAIPPALKGRDVLGCARTGTGKTCAFAVPILQRLNARPDKAHPIRALILTPTRELAIQNQECFEAYGKNLSLRSTVIFGGVGQNPQVEALKKGTDVLIATPGRLQDLYDQGFVDVTKLEIFVLDEADRMLDMGFIHDVRRILKWLPEKKQTLFFSATMPKEITDLVNSLLKDPVRIAVDPVSSPVEVIRQRLYFVDRGNKTTLLADILEQEQVRSALVFTRTKHGANKVAGDLIKRGINAAAIHGNKSQTARQAALNGFKDGTVRVLVATDIAARGLDIEDLPYVFNWNLPDVPETYVHRIGRTGRAGREGVAISFCDFGEQEMLTGIEKLIGKHLPVVRDHPYPMEQTEIQKDKKGRPVNPEDQEAREAARERSHARREAEKTAQRADEKPDPALAEEPVAVQPSKKKKKKPAAEAAPAQAKTEKSAAKIAPAQPKVEQPAPAPAKPAAKKPANKKKAKAKPQVEENPALSEPALRPKQTGYVRPARTTSLDDYLNAADAEEYDYSEFPLLAAMERGEKPDKAEPFMDATERMFATHSSRYREAYAAERGVAWEDTPEPEKKPAGKKPRRSASEPVKQEPAAPRKTEKRTAKQEKPKKQTKPAEKKPAALQKQEKSTEKKAVQPKQRQQEKPTQKNAPAPAKQAKKTKPAKENIPQQTRLLKPAKRRKIHDRPPEEHRSVYAAQKDSTEQKSLMKPYYLHDDD